MPTSTLTLSIPLGDPPFEPEVVVDERHPESRRPAYAPWLPDIAQVSLPPEVTAKVWDAFEKEKTTVENFTQSETLYVGAGDFNGELVHESPDLMPVRYGHVIVKVYGPRKARNDDGVEVILNEQLTVLDALEPLGETLGAEVDLFAHQKSQWKNKDPHEMAQCSVTGYLGGIPYSRTYLFPGNLGRLAGPQVESRGRRVERFKETLTFNGEAEKRIKFWYMDKSVVYVLFASNFVDGAGKPVNRPRNSDSGGALISTGFGGVAVSYDAPGVVFRAEKPCYGTLLVEYDVEYTEFSVLYDYDTAVRRQYRVSPNRPQRIGFITRNTQNVEVAKGNALPGVTFAVQKTLTKKETGDPQAVSMGYTIFPKVDFLPLRPRPLMFVYSNQLAAQSFSFSPPEPDFLDIPETDLPKQAVFELRRQVRQYPQGAGVDEYVENDLKEEIKLIDVLGRITTLRSRGN